MEKLILDLPPSVNNMFRSTRSGDKFRHSKEYAGYLEYGTWIVHAYCRRYNLSPIKWYRHIDIDWYLKDVRSDSHNMKKALFDCLEKGGMFLNDRYIMDRTQTVKMDTTRPRVEINLLDPQFL